METPLQSYSSSMSHSSQLAQSLDNLDVGSQSGHVTAGAEGGSDHVTFGRSDNVTGNDNVIFRAADSLTFGGSDNVTFEGPDDVTLRDYRNLGGGDGEQSTFRGREHVTFGGDDDFMSNLPPGITLKPSVHQAEGRQAVHNLTTSVQTARVVEAGAAEELEELEERGGGDSEVHDEVQQVNNDT